jgi:hypothetical protein
MTPYQLEKVHAALADKLKPCPGCGVPETLIVMDKYLLVPLHDTPSSTTAAASVMPCVVLCCSNCGQVQTHNIHKLGVADFLGIPDPTRPL